MYLNYYLKMLEHDKMPEFLLKYLNCPSLVRLKKVGYFCGMDYASNNIYDFKEYISRFDHSLTTALLVYKLTKDKIATLAGLFHDISTPCFSHVIDYMNQDYEMQESTEKYTEQVLREDRYFIYCLKQDNIDIDDIINYKKYSVVDNDRPKLCADRLDGIILTGAIWTQNITINDITTIINDIVLYKNEFDELEIGFNNTDVAKKVIDVNNNINLYCHSKEDNYMMLLLSKITKLLIVHNYISYEDLYTYNEEELFTIINNVDNLEIKELIYLFKTIKKEDIVSNNIPNLKNRDINPLVNHKRINGEIITTGYKCFNKGLINKYGIKYEIGKWYHTDGVIKYGNDGNGYHMCKNLEDTLRYFNCLKDDVDICKVKCYGKKAEGQDDYNGYYNMYAFEYLYINKVLSRQEIIKYAMNLTDYRLIRFLQQFRLTIEEIALFKARYYNNQTIIDVIAYYQENDKERYNRKYKKH